jgi:hypothetical protein
MFIAALFTTAKLWNNSMGPRIDEWIRKYGPYTQWGIIYP